MDDVRRWYGWDCGVFPHVEDQIRRRVGLAPLSGAATALTGVLAVAIRLVPVLLATAIAGDWAGIPWGRWILIFLFFAVNDAGTPFIGPPVDVPQGPRVRRVIEGWTPLLPTIVRESDLRDLAGFLRRWYRPLVGTAIGGVVAALMLTASWVSAPTAMSELPAGTIALLAWLLFEFGAIIMHQGVVVQWALMAREARYDHNLFWPSPADAPEVKKALRQATNQGSAAGVWITGFLLLAVTLVGLDSPLVVPLGAGFILIGYLVTLGTNLSRRRSVQNIVRAVQEQHLRGLREHIDAYGPRYAELSPQESGHLHELLYLHDKIRDAPTTPGTTRTVMDTAIRLIIPTILFLATAFGEVYVERFLDAILP